MRLYYTGGSPANIRTAREHAPSHSHGFGWTPQKMTPHDCHYFVDNGCYSDKFDGEAWVGMLDRARSAMPTPPDFIVWPDVYGDAEATAARHRHWLTRRRDGPAVHLRDDWVRYGAVHPGRPIGEQVGDLAGLGFDGVFVGGPLAWKRAFGEDIVRLADEYDLRTHVGSPGGADGLVWAYRTGFDSLDTTGIFQHQAWHYLDALEEATRADSDAKVDQPDSSGTSQASVTDW